MHDPIWITRDGRRMHASEMDDRHLANAIAKIRRSTNWRKHWLPRLLLEQLLRRIKEDE